LQFVSSVLFLFVCAISIVGCDRNSSDDALSAEMAVPTDKEVSKNADESTLVLRETSEDVDALVSKLYEGKPVIHWAKPGLAPLFVYEGANAGRGIGDQMFGDVQALMPQFHHVNLRLNYPRLLEELRRGSDVCAILHRTQERERFMVFSQPVVITPSYQLYVSTKGLERFKQQTGWNGAPASFDQLLSKSNGLKMAVTPGQSYGADRDEILARHANKVELVKSFADQRALIKMLAANRMELVLGFPWVVNYATELLDIRADLVKVELNDVPQYEPAYIACADTVFGKRIVDVVDGISPSVHDRSKSYLTRWLTAKESQSYFGVYHAHFVEGKPLP